MCLSMDQHLALTCEKKLWNEKKKTLNLWQQVKY